MQPTTLQRLLHAESPASRDDVWRDLLREHSRLLLHVARSLTAQHDGAMDAYAFVLERLREDDYRRLRGYEADGRSQFSTWLVVVARRLCLDFYRRRYGRARGMEWQRDGGHERAARRRLVDLAATQIDLTSLADEGDTAPDRDLRVRQLYDALDAALSCLEADDRLFLKLRFEDELTADQIATILGYPTPFHVYRRLNAIYGKLRLTLRGRGVENSVP